MRTLFILACLANVAFAFGSLPWLPNPMPSHFALDGTPNGFGPPLLFAVLTSVIMVFMTAIFLGVSWLMSICPPYCFNIPNRDFWMNDENRPETIRRLRLFMESLGSMTLLFFLFVQWEVFQAARTVPAQLEPSAFWIGTAAFLAYVLFAIVQMFLMFRLPKEQTS